MCRKPYRDVIVSGQTGLMLWMVDSNVGILYFVLPIYTMHAHTFSYPFYLRSILII